MSNKIVLVSDDKDFFEYIRTKLLVRKTDEIFYFSFEEIPEKFHLLDTAVLIINSENNSEKTIDLLKIIKGTPAIVSAYNNDDDFKQRCYKNGAFDFITILTPDAELQARMIPALTVASLLEKNNLYKEILVNHRILTKDNEIFIDYNMILEFQLKNIKNNARKAVFVAISPNDTSKFFLNPNIIETNILNNLRKNDILMNYAANKYFLLLLDINVNNARKLWDKISLQFKEKLYAGFVNITNQSKEQLINKALNELHFEINKKKNISNIKNNPIQSLSSVNENNSTYTNFKMFRQEFEKKIEQIITPVFYQIQQKYTNKLAGVTLLQGSGEGYGNFYIKNKNSSSCFKITSPGFSKINIDITYQKDAENIDSKRITLEPEELEAGLLTDLLEQFIKEYFDENI